MIAWKKGNIKKLKTLSFTFIVLLISITINSSTPVVYSNSALNNYSETSDSVHNSIDAEILKRLKAGEKPNHLINEKSPYLLMHAFNPVNWYPWGKEAFDLAKKEDKPIFLSVGYYTCYWCHVMERKIFENDSLAALMNKYFVCIKVDKVNNTFPLAKIMIAYHINNHPSIFPLDSVLYYSAYIYICRKKGILKWLNILWVNWQMKPE